MQPKDTLPCDTAPNGSSCYIGHQPTHAHGLLILERSPLGHFQIGLGVLQERTRMLVSAVEGLVFVVLLVAHRSPSPKGYRRMVLLV
jgi:hypothetical protein